MFNSNFFCVIVMNRNLSAKIAFFLLSICCFPATDGFAQSVETQAKNVNFRHSQNPKTRNKPEPTVSEVSIPVDKEEIASVEKTSIAKKTLEIARRANTSAMSPTEIYKVGIGDILFINIQNSPKSSTYYTVLNDGTLDFPLAGEMFAVSGMLTEEIEDLLKEKIKLYENPQVSVKVREYASHSISVLGLVERAGEKKIQREAVPLFVVRAEAIVSPKATQANIRRAGANSELIDLSDPKSENVLVFPGDIVEFAAAKTRDNNTASQFYYIGGDIISGGQKDLVNGITLTQAILVSGGLKKSNIKRVVIRRKNADGLLMGREYNLKNIKDGKEPDPQILAGDTVEIGN